MSPGCDVCGSRTHVVSRDKARLRPDVAPWVRLVCGRCAIRLGAGREIRGNA